MKNKRAFSLIEVVIATWIISVSVFWVYKMIWENTKIINKSSEYFQINTLFQSLEECIENKWNIDFYWIIWDEYSFVLWNNYKDCDIESLWSNTINWINYFLRWKIIEKNTDYINWQLEISSDNNSVITQEFKQIKK